MAIVLALAPQLGYEPLCGLGFVTALDFFLHFSLPRPDRYHREGEMENRELIAYALILVLAFSYAVGGWIAFRRQMERKRRRKKWRR